MDINNQYDLAAGIGFFLQAQGLPSYGSWSGKVDAKTQRHYFGCYMGKGTLYVNGQDETIEMNVKVCFGTDTITVVKLDAKYPGKSFCNDLTKQEVLNLMSTIYGTDE